jgi:hypothetical protein
MLDQHSHPLACRSVSDEVADAQDPDDHSVRRIVEPLRGHFDQPRPGDRLGQAIAYPRDAEQRQAQSRGKHQGEGSRPGQADEETDPAAPEVTQSGQEQLAQRVGEHAQGRYRAHANHGLAMVDAVPAQFLDQ